MKLFYKSDETKELVKANNQTNRNRDRILILAVAVAVIVLFSAFSIAKGKVIIDSIKHLRESGSAATAYLENGNEEQYEELKSHNDVEALGAAKVFGEWYQKDVLLARCEVVDEAGYEKIIKPAYDGIVGKYPKAKNEIMMSRKLLEKLDINDYEIGTKIAVPVTFGEWAINDGYELTEEFVLSGYYDDYVDESENAHIVYFSEEYLDSKNIAMYPANLLIKPKSNFGGGEQIEKRLYRDIELVNDQQQFIGVDSANMQAVEQFVGGYGIAILCAVVILLSAYLLIYNILSISFNKDMRNYGLLFAIGLTQKQIKKMIFKQSGVVIVKGTLIGVIISIIISAIGFPLLFRGLFLEQKGVINAGMVIYPEILVGAVLLVAIIMLTASGQTTEKLQKLTPVEAYKYNPVDTFSYKKKTSKEGASLGKMAWYNLFRSKRRFFITALALFLGCEVALLAVFITNGTDTMNELSQKPDFEIGIQKDAVSGYLFSYSIDGFEPDIKKPLFNEGFMKEILNISELDKNSIKETYGYYGYFKPNEEFIQPKEKSAHGTGMSNTGMTIQVVDDQYIQKLEKYVESNQLNVDVDSLKRGDGILVLHKHELSESLEAEAIKTIGKPAFIYSVDEGDSEEGTDLELTCVGYLDTTREGFPDLNMSWNGDGINYFLISEKGAKQFEQPRQVFDFAINAKEGQEEIAKAKLVELVRDKNNEQSMVNVYYLSSTSDELMQKENYINNSRLVMIALSVSLFLLGMANYLNVLITNIISRKNEFAIMESIGMTKRQLKKMLTMEGVYYWTILVITLLSLGTLIAIVVGFVVKKTVPYFKFIYPIKEFTVLAIILLVFCVIVPRMVYRKFGNRSVMEQLRSD